MFGFQLLHRGVASHGRSCASPRHPAGQHSKETGKSLTQLSALLKRSGLAKHGELRDYLKKELSLGHGDANTVVHVYLNPESPAVTGESPPATEDVVAGIYTGPKAALRPIHDKLLAAISKFGEFEIAPKKTYLSLRRRKQFAMIGPATNTRVEVGLNMKGVSGTDRLVEQPAGAMCNFKIKLTSVDEVDQELIGWINQAFDAAG